MVECHQRSLILLLRRNSHLFDQPAHFRQFFKSDALDREVDAQRIEHQADLLNLREVGDRDVGDERAAVGRDHDQFFGFFDKCNLALYTLDILQVLTKSNLPVCDKGALNEDELSGQLGRAV